LKTGNAVILKGNLSHKVRQQLESLFIQNPYIYLNGTKHELSGKLILLTQIKNSIPFVKPSELIITPAETWELLSKYASNKILYNVLKEAITLFQTQTKFSFSYGQLKLMLQRLENGNYTNPIAHFLRLVPTPHLGIAKNIWKDLQTKLPNSDT